MYERSRRSHIDGFSKTTSVFGNKADLTLVSQSEPGRRRRTRRSNSCKFFPIAVSCMAFIILIRIINTINRPVEEAVPLNRNMKAVPLKKKKAVPLNSNMKAVPLKKAETPIKNKPPIFYNTTYFESFYRPLQPPHDRHINSNNQLNAKSKQNETIVAGNISSLLGEMNTSTSITFHDMNETSGAHLLLLKNETKNETKTTIPKVIYKILITADGKLPEIDSLHSKNQRDALLSWTDKNPGYNIRYFGLDDSRSYLKEHFHPVVLRAFDCIKANSGKTNLIRAAVVYREGGWYSDWREVLLYDGMLDKLVDASVRKGDAFVFAWDRGTPLARQNNCVMTAFFGGPPPQNPSELRFDDFYHVLSYIVTHDTLPLFQIQLHKCFLK